MRARTFLVFVKGNPKKDPRNNPSNTQPVKDPKNPAHHKTGAAHAKGYLRLCRFGQRFVPDAVRCIGGHTHAAAAIGFVILIIAFKPFDLAIAFKR